MLPPLFGADSVNVGSSDTIMVGQYLPAHHRASDIKHVLFFQNCVAVALPTAMGAVNDTISTICHVAIVSQIDQAVVSFATAVVASFGAFRTEADKSQQDQMRNQTALPAKCHLGVPRRMILSTQNFPLDLSRVSSNRRIFCGDYAAQASHPPQIGNFVRALKPRNGFPNFR